MIQCCELNYRDLRTFAMDSKYTFLGFILIFSVVSVLGQPTDENDLYRVIWNSRVERCGPKYGLPINLTQWGIEQNTYGSGWHGDLITLLGGKYGAWPWMSKDGKIYNGGVPFKANFSQHFENLVNNLKTDLGSDFKGLGVFDIEIYRPLFTQNFGAYKKYKDYSIKLIKIEHPSWTKQEIGIEAERLWNEASKQLFGGTLLTARDLLQDNQAFGFYHYPQCFGFHRESNECHGASDNDKMNWLWQASTALFPSIYFYNSQPNVTRRRLCVYGNVMESVRCRENVNKPHMPIYPYSKYNIRLHPTTLYTMVDLINSIGQVADLGVEGIVLWGDAWSETNQSRCQETKNYMDNLLGPYVKTVKQFVQKCSAYICGSRGRCYTTDPARALDETVYQTGIRAFRARYASDMILQQDYSAKIIQALSLVAKATTEQFKSLHKDEFITTDLYKCRCLPGYSGERCANKYKDYGRMTFDD